MKLWEKNPPHISYSIASKTPVLDEAEEWVSVIADTFSGGIVLCPSENSTWDEGVLELSGDSERFGW